jgi:hypothetical protein
VEPRNLYFSPGIIRISKSRSLTWAGNAAFMGNMRNSYKVLVRKPEGKRWLRWKNVLKMDI